MATKTPLPKPKQSAVREPIAATPAKAAPVAAIVKTPVVEAPPAAAPAIVEAVAPVTEQITAAVADAAPAIKKEETTMEATIKDAAENVAAKGQAYLSDLTARAKSAFDNSGKTFEDINDFHKGNLEALVESSKIATTGLQSLGQGYADYARRQFEGMTATMKSFAGIKSPTEFAKLQADFVRGQFDSMVAETSKNTEALLKLAGDVAKPISNRVSLAAEKLKVAA